MEYTVRYESPIGTIILTVSESALTGLRFDDQSRSNNYTQQENAILEEAQEWLNIYFSGKEPGFRPKIHYDGTSFQNEVWNILNTIRYGETIAYGEIARQIARRRGLKKMSAQAVGGAISKNRIAIIIPCHRVIGNNQKPTGYSGGLERKIKLLELEQRGRIKL